MRALSYVAFTALAASCSRTPEEPVPVKRDPVALTGPTAPVATKANATPPAPASPCPADPEPSLNDKLYEHGEIELVTPGGDHVHFHAEIARSDDAQERGLMYRTSLAEDAAMVFVFDVPHHAVFWMHNTCIPLDMVFVDESNRVIGVVTAPPLNDDHREVPGFSKYVIELAAGVASKRGLALGTTFVPPP